jgi:3-hydroxybutyryl-CoA dehydratase
MKQWKVGDTTETKVKVTDAMVRAFAEVSGDFNPIHLDAEFAATTRFKQRIAHGMLSASFISRALANDMPGAGSVYLGQSLKFTAPVFIDETIAIKCTMTAIREDKGIATIETIVTKENGEVAIKGEATALIPK